MINLHSLSEVNGVFMVHSEILEDIRLDLMFIQPSAEFFRLIDGKLDVIQTAF